MSKGDMGDKGTTMLDRVHTVMDYLAEKNVYIDELAEQKRSKLEQNIQYMHFEKEAKQVGGRFGSVYGSCRLYVRNGCIYKWWTSAYTYIIHIHVCLKVTHYKHQ